MMQSKSYVKLLRENAVLREENTKLQNEIGRMREYVGKINTEADLYSTAYWLTKEILEKWGIKGIWNNGESKDNG